MDVPQTFDTARLHLRRPMESDAAAVLEYAGDAEVARHADWPRLENLDQARRAVADEARRWASGEEYAWRITVPPNGDPVGAVACSIDGHRAEIGFLLHRRLWGQGHATEAARAVLDWLTSLPEVERVQATCDIDNLASARVLEKLGMQREGVLRRWAIRPNLPGRPIRDALLYAWVRREE